MMINILIFTYNCRIVNETNSLSRLNILITVVICILNIKTYINSRGSISLHTKLIDPQTRTIFWIYFHIDIFCFYLKPFKTYNLIMLGTSPNLVSEFAHVLINNKSCSAARNGTLLQLNQTKVHVYICHMSFMQKN